MPIKIVLVEDSETVQRAVKMIMQSERDFEIQCFKQPSEFKELGATADLLVIDLSLSANSDSLYSQPVIFLVGPKTLMPAATKPNVSYLRKPFDSLTFLKAIQSALAVSQKTPERPVLPLPPMDHVRPTAPQASSPHRTQDAPLVATAAQTSAQNLPMNPEEFKALARKIIEEVAWEVVPELAESIIREEIRRLTK